jgi:putative transposase
LLTIGFIKRVEEATWLSLIVAIPKKNGKFRICVNFKKLYATTKKDPCPLPFIDEILNTIVRHDVYSFLNGYSIYHHKSIALEDKYKTSFVTY